MDTTPERPRLLLVDDERALADMLVALFRLVLPAHRAKKTPSKSRKAHDHENH